MKTAIVEGSVTGGSRADPCDAIIIGGGHNGLVCA